MNNKNNKTKTFEVDAKGFKVQMEEIGTGRLIAELISNSLDEESVGTIKVRITKHGELVHVTVNDDGDGFRDVEEIWTLFADSYKRTDPTKRGRFNLGEKQFLITCEDAYIKTGDHHVIVSGAEKEVKRLSKKFEGVEVFGRIRESVQSRDEVLKFLERIAVPDGKKLYINDTEIESTPIVKSFKEKLNTPVATSAYRPLRDRPRETEVHLYQVSDGETAWIYEKGIPVQKLDDHIKWHVDVQQKVPQVIERNVVKSAYLKTIYTAVAENCLDIITEEDAGQTWVTDALENTSVETTSDLLKKKYGTDKICIESQDYRENEKAALAGYRVLKGTELNRDIKDNLKSNEQLAYASKEFSCDNFECAKSVEETSEMKFFAQVCKAIARETISKEISVSFVTTKHTNEAAQYGHNSLSFNVRNCGGKRAFEDATDPRLLGLVIHELAHDKLGNNYGHAHLSHDYIHEQERIAGICFSKGIDYYITECKKVLA